MNKKYNGFYLVANYPDEKTFIQTAIAGLKYFDFLEIGIPFSDPIADGAAISEAAYTVLKNGFKVKDAFAPLKKIREAVAPEKKIYFMTYSNIVIQYGICEFSEICKKYSVNGVILADVPYIESHIFKNVFSNNKIDFIHFVTPENNPAQIKQISKAAQGFLYCISVRGITGGQFKIDAELKNIISISKKNSAVPVVLGFGIRNRNDVITALKFADGFIIGTKIIELLKNKENFETFCKEIFAV